MVVTFLINIPTFKSYFKFNMLSIKFQKYLIETKFEIICYSIMIINYFSEVK